MNVSEIQEQVGLQMGLDQPRIGIPHKINICVDDFRARGNWTFWHTFTHIQTETPYDTGTVAVTAGSSSVVGTSTNWSSTAHAGKKIKFGSPQGSETYTVESVATTAALVITPALASTSDLSAESYTIFEDEFSVPSDFQSLRAMWDETQQRWIQLDAATSVMTIAAYNLLSVSTAYRVGLWNLDSSDNPKLKFWPYPVTTSQILMWYNKKPTAVSGPGDTPDLPTWLHTTIVQGVLARCLRDNKDPGWQSYEMDYRQRLESLWIEDQRKVDNPRVRRIRNDSSDSYAINYFDRVWPLGAQVLPAS